MREPLTSARTYYVRTDGSDSNNGFSNTSAGAFLTLQAAVNSILQNIDTQGFNVTVQVANGTYGAGATISRPLLGGGQLVFNGDIVTPSNVVINSSGNGIVTTGNPTVVRATGFKISASGTCLFANNGAVLLYGAIDFGTATNHVSANQRSYVQALNNCTISGGASAHITAQFSSNFQLASLVMSVTGNPNFTVNFINCFHLSYVNCTGTTFSGTATGNRYVVGMLAAIYGVSGNVNYFPGNVAGSIGTGAKYI